VLESRATPPQWLPASSVSSLLLGKESMVAAWAAVRTCPMDRRASADL
jgi:hypothetical protein